jgi:protein-disulfide isomerase
MKEIMKTYGDRVKFVWRDFPLSFHHDAPLASEAAREALKQKGPDAFWKMHDTLFANQQKIKREDLDNYAKDLKLDMDKWKNALDNHVHKPTIDAEVKAGNDAQVQGTPAFWVNNYFIGGVPSVGKLRRLIERALAEAK